MKKDPDIENIEETIGKLMSKGTIFCTNRESSFAAFSRYRHLKQYRMPFKNKEKFKLLCEYHKYKSGYTKYKIDFAL